MKVGISVSRFGDGWRKLDNLKAAGKAFIAYFEDSPRAMANAVSREMRKALRSTKLPRNSMATIIMKGSNTPLVDSGKLLDSIETVKLGPFDYYGGVDPVGREANGHSFVSIALAQNSGYIVPVTEGLRNYMSAFGIDVHPDTQFFVVPPRPFLSMGLENADPKIQAIMDDMGRHAPAVFGF